MGNSASVERGRPRFTLLSGLERHRRSLSRVSFKDLGGLPLAVKLHLTPGVAKVPSQISLLSHVQDEMGRVKGERRVDIGREELPVRVGSQELVEKRV